MSNIVNDQIIERARELSEECTNSVLGAALDRAIKHGDLELVQTLTIAAERYIQYAGTINDDNYDEVM